MNYLGRKTFSFSEDDVRALREILVLRNTGFSVEEILTMQREPERITALAAALSARTEAAYAKNQYVLDSLARLELSQIRSVSELAEALTTAGPVQGQEPAEDRGTWGQRALSFCKSALFALAIWLPLLIAVFGVVMSFRHYLYPVFYGKAIVCMLLLLLPSALLFTVQKLRLSEKIKRRFQIILLILCVISIPLLQFWAVFAVDRSQTENQFHYRVFDSRCEANFDDAFQSFFPMEIAWFERERYHYRYDNTVFGDSCDVFVQRKMTDAEFDEEIARVSVLFSEDRPAWDDSVLREYRDGAYTCLLRFCGQSPVSEAETERIYNDAYYLFAYDSETNTVLYFYFNSVIGGVESSYYCSGAWR